MRLGGLRPDRRLAAGAFAVAVVLFAVLAAVTSAPVPPLAARDDVAAATLVRLLRRGEQLDRLVVYRTSRSAPKRGKIDGDLTEARYRGHVVLRSGSTLSISLPDHVYECEQLDTVSCHSQPPDRSLPTSEVIDIAVKLGAYDVIPLASQNIAHEPARCFAVNGHRGHLLTGLGSSTRLCLSRDGLILRTAVEGPSVDESRVATSALRNPSFDDLAPVFAGFVGGPEALGQ